MARPLFAETARETSAGVFVNGNAAVSKKTLSGGENPSIAASPPERWAKINFADGHFRAAAYADSKFVGHLPRYWRFDFSVRCTQIGKPHSAQSSAISVNCPDKKSNPWTPSCSSPTPMKPRSFALFISAIDSFGKLGFMEANAEILSGWRAAKSAIWRFRMVHVPGFSQYQALDYGALDSGGIHVQKKFLFAWKSLQRFFPVGALANELSPVSLRGAFRPCFGSRRDVFGIKMRMGVYYFQCFWILRALARFV